MDHYHGNGSFPVFFPSPGKFKLSETQNVLKKAELNFFITTVQQLLQQAEFSFHCKRYRSEFSNGRQRLQTFTKWRRVRSLKESMPYNKQLTNLSCSGPHSEILYWPR